MSKLIFRLTPGESLDFPLNAGVTRLGRHPSNEIVINNTWISSKHAEFTRIGESITVRDTGSSNGTTVNGEAISTCALKDGDRLGFGQLEAVYDAEGIIALPVPAAPASTPPVSLATACPPALAKRAAAVPAPASAPVLVRAMAAPSASIAYDNVRKEGELELAELKQKLSLASIATAEALKERSAAETANAAAGLELKATQEQLEKLHLATETARTGAAEEAVATAAAHEQQLAALAALTAETEVLAARRNELKRELTAETAAALDARRSAAKTLTDCQTELAEAGVNLTKILEEQERCQRELTTRQSAFSDGQSRLQVLTTAVAAANADQDRLLAEIEASAGRLDEVKETTAGLQKQSAELEAENASLSKLNGGLKSEILQMQTDASQGRARRAAATEEMDALTTRIAAAREAASEQERGMAVRLTALDDLEIRHNTLSANVSLWEQQKADALESVARLAAAQSEVEKLHAEAAQVLAAQTTANTALARATARNAALTDEAATVQARLDHLRREIEGAEALNSKVTDLRKQQGEAERRLDFLTDRLAGMSEAPDPNWGTVHSLARSFIKKLDLMDDLMAHLTGQPKSASTLEQLSVFRSGLLDILKEYSIEAYSLEPGTVIDVAARKRIQIVETLSEGSHDGTRIVRTYRPGYVCLNGDLGISTLLRKADVAVSIPLG